MDEKDYELILTLYELKNITKTAEKLFITQPALTKRIKKIEKDLGIELLLRSKKGVLFTPLGESILPYIKTVTSTLLQMREYVVANQGFIGGTLIAGVSFNYSHYYLPKILKNFTEAFPTVDVNIITQQSRNLYRLLENDKISLAVVRGEYKLGGTSTFGEYKWDETSILLNTEPMCLVCSNENAKKPLNSYSYISRRVDSTLQRKIQTWLAENGLSSKNTKLWIDDISTCLEMAKHGLGWTIVPKVCLRNFDGYSKDLYFADGTPFNRSFYILCKNSYYKLPQVKLFIQYLLNNEGIYEK